MISQDKLKVILNYEPDTGIFTWKKRKSTKTHIGDIAGSKNFHGYFQIKIDYKLYLCHRLAWLYIYGEWPKNQLDHINGVRSDNRICNLREVTNSQNAENRIKAQRNNSTGYLGVSYYKRLNKYTSKILVNGKEKNLGYFEDAISAHKEYIKAKRKFHQFSTI